MALKLYDRLGLTAFSFVHDKGSWRTVVCAWVTLHDVLAYYRYFGIRCIGLLGHRSCFIDCSDFCYQVIAVQLADPPSPPPPPSVCVCVQDLTTSHNLVAEMKKIAKNNVKQVSTNSASLTISHLLQNAKPGWIQVLILSLFRDGQHFNPVLLVCSCHFILLWRGRCFRAINLQPFCRHLLPPVLSCCFFANGVTFQNPYQSST